MPDGSIHRVGPWTISSSSSTSSTATHIASGTLGGAALGASVLGPLGAVIGGVVGIALSTGTEIRITKDPSNLAPPVPGSL